MFRYALGEMVESEKDYISDLTELIEKMEAEDPRTFRNKAGIMAELKKLAEFHRGLFLPELVDCLDRPTEVAEIFMKWVRLF